MFVEIHLQSTILKAIYCVPNFKYEIDGGIPFNKKWSPELVKT